MRTDGFAFESLFMDVVCSGLEEEKGKEVIILQSILTCCCFLKKCFNKNFQRVQKKEEVWN